MTKKELSGVYLILPGRSCGIIDHIMKPSYCMKSTLVVLSQIVVIYGQINPLQEVSNMVQGVIVTVWLTVPFLKFPIPPYP